MEKIKLNNTALVTYIYADTQHRVDNLKYIIKFYNQYLDVPIWVIENGETQKVDLSDCDCNYVFIKTPSNTPLKKNKYVNLIYNIIPEPIVTYFDADVLVLPEALAESCEIINSGKYDFVWPVHVIRYAIKENSFADYPVDRDAFLYYMVNMGDVVWTKECPCAAFMFNKVVYRNYGLDNPEFIGAWHEDQERNMRLLREGHPRIFVQEGEGFHLNHPRPENSFWANPQLMERNLQKSKEIRFMPDAEVPKYINNLVAYDKKASELYDLSKCEIKCCTSTAFSLFEFMTRLQYSVKSIVDVGCGRGYYLMPYISREVDVFGIDINTGSNLLIPKNKYFVTDIREPYIACRQFDVAMCVGIAEYLPECCSENLVKTLTGFSSMVIFSPTTSTTGVLNYHGKNPDVYWQELFSECGYHADYAIRDYALHPAVDFSPAMANTVAIYIKN